jgi:hypothetical protein
MAPGRTRTLPPEPLRAQGYAPRLCLCLCLCLSYFFDRYTD